MKLNVKLLLLIAVVSGAAVPIIWGTTETAIKATSDYEFCSTCHSMQAMTVSYLADTHGGNNIAGIRASCSDCHLPHDNAFVYLAQKAKSGAWDVYKEHIAGADDVDWLAKRERREQYTYESGCLNCHNEIKQQKVNTAKSWLAHGPVFRGEVDKSCVSCHQHVGHHNLAQALLNAGLITKIKKRTKS